ncbi:MAG: UDP-glucose 4-epimerase GalE [Desulfatitalea sp.]|nr:UDP-glucose 4-epimerase GalE [Desulfatitalea sp.]NNK01845.1 UDP-glucose 4-epimerase GalE [Desulfatitalea sp.]
MKKQILVVGGCGYIGTHMVKALLDAGYEVLTLDNLSTGHREFLPGGQFVFGDIRDSALLDKVFTGHTINAVMHFAALIEVRESVKLPLKYYQNNVSATINLLDAMARHNVDKFIFSSSAAVYGEPEYIPLDENHPCRPTNPYGRTKLMIEEVLSDTARTGKIKYTALRYFNAAGADNSGTIGENHTPESHLIPLVLQVALGKRDNITIFGSDHDTPDGTCIRDYVHVNDLAQAHLLALKALENGITKAAYNLGTSRGYSVLDVIKTARKITTNTIPARQAEKRQGDPAVLVASSEKAKKELGWHPQYENLDAIIESAWKWHQKQMIPNDATTG